MLQGPPFLGAAFAVVHGDADTWARLATLMLANVLLVTHIFLVNDWSGLGSDLADPNKASRVFTARGVDRNEMAVFSAAMLAASLLLFWLLGPVTFGIACAIAALSALYSLPPFGWKGLPLLSSAAHLAGGVLHFLLGYSLARPIDARGIATAAFFALIFTAGHLVQEIRDHCGDARSGILTNAVRFGSRRAFVVSTVLFTAAHAILLALALRNIVPRALAVVVVAWPLHLWWCASAFRDGLTYASICRLQTRYRVLYALAGVVMVAVLWQSA